VGGRYRKRMNVMKKKKKKEEKKRVKERKKKFLRSIEET